MPVRRRVPRQEGIACDPMLFVYGDGTRHRFGGQALATLEAAMSAWPAVRRAAWGLCWRGRVPRAATVFDGVTDSGIAAARNGLSNVDYPLREVLAALSGDRRTMRRFELDEPDEAAGIADYLAVWRADLDYAERIARRAAAERYSVGIHDLSPACRYGEPARQQREPAAAALVRR